MAIPAAVTVTITPGRDGLFIITVTLPQPDGSTRVLESTVSPSDLVSQLGVGNRSSSAANGKVVIGPIFLDPRPLPTDGTGQLVWNGLPQQRRPARAAMLGVSADPEPPAPEKPVARRLPSQPPELADLVSVGPGLVGPVATEHDPQNHLPAAVPEIARRGSTTELQGTARATTQPVHGVLEAAILSSFLVPLPPVWPSDEVRTEITRADEYFTRLELLEKAGGQLSRAGGQEGFDPPSKSGRWGGKADRSLLRLAVAWLLWQAASQTVGPHLDADAHARRSGPGSDWLCSG